MEKKNENMEKGTLHETLGENNPENNGEVGPVVGIIIVLIVLISGALYFFFQEVEKAKERGPAQPAQEILKEKDVITEKLKVQSKSDEIDKIEKDLEETNIENLEDGIENIEKELGI